MTILKTNTMADIFKMSEIKNQYFSIFRTLLSFKKSKMATEFKMEKIVKQNKPNHSEKADDQAWLRSRSIFGELEPCLPVSKVLMTR
jgi:hypothetical protein